MDKEYIERNSLWKALDVAHLFDNGNPRHIAQQVVEEQPVADVVEVVHGEWVKETRTADVCAEYRCSLCGFMYCEADPKYPPYKYCPECGANNE